MELVKAEVSVNKEAYELGIALAKIAVEVKKLLADGAQISDALALLPILLSPEVQAGLSGLDKLPADFKENKGPVITALVVAGVQVAEAL